MFAKNFKAQRWVYCPCSNAEIKLSRPRFGPDFWNDFTLFGAYSCAMNTRHIEPFAVSPKQAAFLSSLSKRKVHELMSKGVLPFRKVGRRTLIPLAALRKLLLGREQ